MHKEMKVVRDTYNAIYREGYEQGCIDSFHELYERSGSTCSVCGNNYTILVTNKNMNFFNIEELSVNRLDGDKYSNWFCTDCGNCDSIK